VLLDEGTLRVYEIKRVIAGGVASTPTPLLRFEAMYGEIGIGTEEWNGQGARGVEVTGRVRIWRDKRVRSGDVIVLADKEQYRAGRVYHGLSEGLAGLEVTDITLEKPTQEYKLPEVEP